MTLGRGAGKGFQLGAEEGLGEQMSSVVPAGPEFLGRENPQDSERHTRLPRTEQRSQYSWQGEGGHGRGKVGPLNK